MKEFIFVFLICWDGVVSHDLSTNFFMERNGDYSENNSRSITNQTSYAECRTQCLKNDKCNAFTWDVTTQMCYLKSSIDNDGQSALFAHSGHRQVVTQKRDASSLLVEIKAGFTKDSSSVKVSGSNQHIITDNEVNTFGIQDSNLKNAITKDFGKTPNNAFLRSPALCTLRNCKEDLYRKFDWTQVTTVLTAVSATILEITTKPVILDRKTSNNQASKKASFNMGISTTVEDTTESHWSTTNSISVSQAVEYGIKFLGSGVSGTTTFSYSREWGQGGSKSRTVGVGTTHGATIELDPGESVVAELTATRGFMKVRILYEAKLTGGSVVEYTNRYKDHHHWCFDIDRVMRAGGLSNSKTFTEDIEIGYYGDSKVTVTSTKFKARNSNAYIEDIEDENNNNKNSKRDNDEYKQTMEEKK